MKITMAHGSGGRATSQLITGIFEKNFNNEKMCIRDSYNILGGVDTTIPVDIYVPGCAARPEAIIDGDVYKRQISGRQGLFLPLCLYCSVLWERLSAAEELPGCFIITPGKH